MIPAKIFLMINLILPPVQASACPYRQLAERGKLSQTDAARLFATRDEETATKMHEELGEFAEQEQFHKRQLLGGLLGLGGGLLGGILQPLSGILEGLDVPTPQPAGLKEIPGDDPAHRYITPMNSDVRGPCTALNTMANHGYISRNGITTFAEVANACQIAFGMAYDICTVLSALGLLAGGDLVSGKYSIGGEDWRVPNTLGPSLGISKHGFFEVDNSITREDAYFGNQADFRLSRWDNLVNIAQNHNGQFGLATFAQERLATYWNSRNNNPQFNAGIKWIIGSNAERALVFRTFASGNDPQNANFENVAPFFLNETFPKNWYRRAVPYTLAEAVLDIVDLITASPSLTVPGANVGFNNFVPLGLNLMNLSPASVTCFLAVTALDEIPGSIAGATAELLSVVQNFVNAILAPFFPEAESCGAIAQYASAGPSVGTIPGVSTTKNILINGIYY